MPCLGQCVRLVRGTKISIFDYFLKLKINLFSIVQQGQRLVFNRIIGNLFHRTSSQVVVNKLVKTDCRLRKNCLFLVVYLFALFVLSVRTVRTNYQENAKVKHQYSLKYHHLLICEFFKNLYILSFFCANQPNSLGLGRGSISFLGCR